MPNPLTAIGNREPVSPTGSASRGSVAGLLGAAVTAWLMSNYPNMTELAVAAGAVTVAFLTGLGNAARNAGGLFKVIFGWMG